MTTVSDAMPFVVINVEGTVAVSVVELRNIVLKGLPFHCTTEPERKLPPVTVKVNVGLSAMIDDGLSAVRMGAGLFI